LYYYPKDLTPGCTIEACDFNENLARIKKKNTVVLGVSFFMGKEFFGIVRSTFIIDKQGKIKKIFSPVKVKGHVDEVIKEL